LPVQLKKYHKLWEKNDRIQYAMDKYRKEIAENLERLEHFVSNASSGSDNDGDEEMPAVQAPAVAAEAQVTYHQRQALRDSDQAQAMNARLNTSQMQFTPCQKSYLSRQMLDALAPSSMPMMLGLQLAARRQAATAPNFWVGNLAVRNPGPVQQQPGPPPAKKARKTRRCGVCRDSGDLERMWNATECAGAAPRSRGQYLPPL
ncbi:MAG: hypothetical protein SGILL_010631, partial [Bacillariaceae sp.]